MRRLASNAGVAHDSEARGGTGLMEGRLRRSRLWLGLLVSAFFLALLLWQVDRDELGGALRDVRPGWLLLAAPVYLGALWTRAWRWRLILRPHLQLGGRDAFALLMIGYAANNVLPVRAGEVVRAGLLQRDHGARWSVGLGTIVVERIFDGLVLTSFLVVTVALAGGNAVLRALAVAGAAGFLAASMLIVLLAARPRAGTAVTRALLRFAPAGLRSRASGWLEGFVGGLIGLGGGRSWALVTGATAAAWGLEAATYWLVGRAFGLGLDAPLYLGVTGAANLAIAAPSTAAGVGPFEFFAREAATVFGADTATATAYALALHALLIVPLTLVALLLLWRRGLGLRTLARAPAEAPAEGAR